MAPKPSHNVSDAAASKGVLSTDELTQLRALAVERLCSSSFQTSYLHAKNNLSLSDMKGFAAHQPALRQLMEPLVVALSEEVLGLRTIPQIATSGDVDAYAAPREQALKKLADYIQLHWKELWQNATPPFAKKDTGMYLEELSNMVVHHLVYPPYTIPIDTKLAMYDRALKHAFDAPFHHATLATSDLMRDDALIETIEDALRGLSDERLRSRQTHTVKLADASIIFGEKNKPTYAAERDWHHSIQSAVWSVKGLDTNDIPTDVYDVFAELEARIGTNQAGTLGAAICQRFIDSLDKAINRFEKTHHLMEPFYYKGQTPSF